MQETAIAGGRIGIQGIVYDGSGTPVRDVLLEAWQANAVGKYIHPADRQHTDIDPSFRGWGRARSNFDTGVWSFETIKPGPVEGSNRGMMAPHVNNLWIIARGVNVGLNTRMYFANEEAANAIDPGLNLTELDSRDGTLFGVATERDSTELYRFDIRQQGRDETVFFYV